MLDYTIARGEIQEGAKILGKFLGIFFVDT